MISILVAAIGIEKLPMLFIANALLIILATAGFSHIFHHIGIRQTITYLAIAAIVVSVGALSVSGMSLLGFYGLSLVSFACIIAQMKIRLEEFVEEIFTPSEGPRVFPVIESAETIGGVIAGLVALGISTYVPVALLLAVTMISLMVIAVLLTIYPKVVTTVPKFNSHIKEKKSKGIFKSFQKDLKLISKHPFLTSSLIVVTCNVMYFQLVEFQFANILAMQNLSASAIAQGFGMFHVVFGCVGLCLQLFAVSRILGKLGISKSITLHPALNLFAVIGLFANMSFPAAFLARLSFETTDIVYKNAYHSSLYMIPKAKRGRVKHFFEGVAAPTGTLIGTLLIVAAGSIFSNTLMQCMFISLVMFGCLMYMTMSTKDLGQKFTLFAKRNINSNNILSKADSIELLAANAKDKKLGVTDIMIDILNDKSESDHIKEMILKSLGDMRQVQTIPHIMEFIYHKNTRLREEAITALNKFDNIAEEFKELGFAKEKVKKILLKIIDDPNQVGLHRRVINLFGNMFRYEAAPFISHLLKSGEVNKMRSAILVCKRFTDREVIPVMRPYLRSEHIVLRAAAVVALWHFDDLQAELKHEVHKIIKRAEEKDLRYVFNMIADIGAHDFENFIKKCIHNDSEAIHREAVYALAKMQKKYAVRHLVGLIFKKDEEVRKEAKDVCATLRGDARKLADKLIRSRASAYIHEVMSETVHHTYEELGEYGLNQLRRAYENAGEILEVAKIDHLVAVKQRI